VSCADAVLASQWIRALPALNPEKVDPNGPGGSAGGGAGGSAKYQHYETKDRRFILFCGIEPKFWDHFCRAVGREDLLDDHNRDLVVDFGGGEDALRLELQRIFHTKTLEEWMQVAARHDVAMGPAVRFDEIQEDPHLVARGMVITEHHPVFGDFLTLGNPLVVPGQTFAVRSAPALGEHTDDILGELGYDEAARGRLRAAGVI
jgi:crotonobetainyl-CoA:carnitine CoA-transferase CaiB-like acyl-CoA transferase